MKEQRAPKDAQRDFELAGQAPLENRSNLNTSALLGVKPPRPSVSSGGQPPGSTQIPTKFERILYLLMNGSLNRFEAEREHDHCLHTTVSTIQKKGVRVKRQWERVPGFLGSEVRVCRYHISIDQREAAEQLLELLRMRTRVSQNAILKTAKSGQVPRPDSLNECSPGEVKPKTGEQPIPKFNAGLNGGRSTQ